MPINLSRFSQSERGGAVIFLRSVESKDPGRPLWKQAAHNI